MLGDHFDTLIAIGKLSGRTARRRFELRSQGGWGQQAFRMISRGLILSVEHGFRIDGCNIVAWNFFRSPVEC